MVISYNGGECFKLVQGDLTIAFNPPAKDSQFPVSKFGSDIVLVSLNHKDFNGVENTSFGDREPFVIAGPGEYEIKGVAVRGFGAPTTYGGHEGINTIYSILLDGVTICFLGACSSAQLPQAAKQDLDSIDILFLPVGGDGVLDPGEAQKLVVQLEPRIVIPMHYKNPQALTSFLKEAGAEGTQAVEKLTLKKKDLEGKEAEIVVLSA